MANLNAENKNDATALPPGTVVVKEDALNAIIKDVERLKEENKMLLEAADVGRISRYQTKHGKPLAKVVKVTRFITAKGEEKYVMASKLISNEVYQDPITRAYHEKQDVELIFEDDTKRTVPNKDFAINATKVDAEIQQTVVDQTGHTTLVVTIIGDEATNGQKLTIDSRFVN